MKMQFKWIYVLVIIMSGFSCSKKSTTPEPSDTIKPVISLIDPTSNKIFTLGSPLHLQIDLTDNVELKSYKVTITKSLKGIQTSDWAFSQTWVIVAGKKTFTVNHSEITIPLTVTGNQTTTGNYEMTMTCTDTSGNEATTTVTITINKL
jgi:hypothetical protein